MMESPLMKWAHIDRMPASILYRSFTHGWPTVRTQAWQQEAAKALGLPVIFRDRLKDGGEGPELVVIPGGEFLMGSSEDDKP